MRKIRAAAILILALAAGLLILQRCTRLPPLGHRTVSTAAHDTAATRLGRAITPLLSAHPGLSGVYPLRDAREAFAARYRLAERAERTLDVQYYIWRNDLSGMLLGKALYDAAERGVRVRLLLDDNNTSGLDTILAALDSHPRIEVRLFNPFVLRRRRALAYLTDFSRLNRRMHNKSFTADNQATIVGGRNIGDEYFGATDGVLFTDLDVIAVGPVVREVSSDFDRYWASPSAYPAERVLAPVDSTSLAELAADASRIEADPAAVAYRTSLRETQFIKDLEAGMLPIEWAAAHMISDDPAKGLGRARSDDLLVAKMRAIFGTPARQVDLVSPYFVPGASGVDLLTGWAKKGVKVRILTNALEATDVAAVHAGYARRRKPLLAGGVALYELRAWGNRERGDTGPFGSSASSLHAKTFAVDRARLFVGSFNFDPRSADLNTEMGFVIESPRLAERMASVFDTDVPANAYEVGLAGNLYWIERHNGIVNRYEKEPGTSAWQRGRVSLLSLFPIEWLLALHRQLGAQALPVAADRGHGRHAAAAPIGDRGIVCRQRSVDLDIIAARAVADIGDDHIEVCAPEKRHRIERLTPAENVPGHALPLAAGHDPVLYAEAFILSRP
jgi:putative cardiolipin synthase